MERPRAWADIDLGALAHNLNQIRSLISKTTRIMQVIKADAYGHGAVDVAHFASRCGIEAFGVGDSHEALELREAGIREPILILGTIVPGEAQSVVEHGISVCLHSGDRIPLLEREAARQNKRVSVHLMIDTGMGRLGVRPDRAVELWGDLCRSQWLKVEGVVTHFAGTEPAELEADHEQLARFQDVGETLGRSGGDVFFHAANSRAILYGLGADLDMVRPGIAAYGILPHPSLESLIDLKPVLSLRTQISFLKDVEPGMTISYGRVHRVEKPTRIATLPLGYNDGILHRLSNRGVVLVRGQRAPLVGAVTMDYTMIDIGHIPGVEVGDTVTLIGQDGEASLTVREVAERAEAIPYELLCSIGKRVRRLYEFGGRP